LALVYFCHDREFIWGPRRFNSVEEMNETIVDRHNSLVLPEDDVYVLGDLMLGDNEKGIELIKQMNGKLHIAIGNHDTAPRIELYKTLPNLVDINYVHTFKYRKYNFYCSHYPTLTGNLEAESLKQVAINLYGHTHQKDIFYEDRPYMFHCGMDSNACACYPINIDYIIDKCNDKVTECIEML
jgi:calcineurin-like phosphoesterase family protein